MELFWFKMGRRDWGPPVGPAPPVGLLLCSHPLHCLGPTWLLPLPLQPESHTFRLLCLKFPSPGRTSFLHVTNSFSHILRLLAITGRSLITVLASNLSRDTQMLTCSQIGTAWGPPRSPRPRAGVGYDVSEHNVKE